MAPRLRAGGLLDRLPNVRGRLVPDAPLAKLTWFRVGGLADVLFRPADQDDLAHFLAERPKDVPVTVLGTGSNVLIRDGGVEGVVVRLGRPFASVHIEGQTLHAGGGAAGLAVARAAARAGLAGLEFMSGIPGTVGGAVRMNAGAFGSDVSAVLQGADILDGKGWFSACDAAALGFSYRHSALPGDAIVVGAHFKGVAGDAATIAARMAAIEKARTETQPVRSPTGGSTFVNPPGHKAWELIDRAGCRGLVLGDAQVSELHCNFLINRGRATAADIEGLGEDVRRRVFAATGIRLEWEIRRIGCPAVGLRAVAPDTGHRSTEERP
ncbi:MAG: UDP-N-acetylmuramate dehydrogenase [Proteobacteria bacterium]|nr:UDP-N-acetylmuramate dehydrogenase [Pseudomonadota bacterium]